MTTLSEKIAETLAAHQPAAGYEWCQGCEWMAGDDVEYTDEALLASFTAHQADTLAKLVREAQAEAMESAAYSLLGAMEYEDSPIAGEATNIRNKQRHEDAQRLFARAASIRETP